MAKKILILSTMTAALISCGSPEGANKHRLDMNSIKPLNANQARSPDIKFHSVYIGDYLLNYEPNKILIDVRKVKASEREALIGKILRKYNAQLVWNGYPLPEARELNESGDSRFQDLGFRSIKVNPPALDENIVLSTIKDPISGKGLRFNSPESASLFILAQKIEDENIDIDVSVNSIVSTTSAVTYREHKTSYGELSNILTLSQMGWQSTGASQGAEDIAWRNAKRIPRIAIVDIGFDLYNPELSGQDVRGGVPANQNSYSHLSYYDFFGCPNPTPGQPCTDSGVSENHGTAVAALAGGAANNGYGVAGVAPLSYLQLYNVGVNRSGSLEAVARSIQNAIAFGADAINMSLIWYANTCTSVAGSAATAQAINFAYQHKIPVITSAGNNNAEVAVNCSTPVSNPAFPGASFQIPQSLPEVIVVGAYDRDYNRSIWGGSSTNYPIGFASNFGSKVDIYAPGGGNYYSMPLSYVWSSPTSSASFCWSNSKCAYENYDYNGTTAFGFIGTSAAAPLVTGVVAMMKAHNYNLTVDQIKTALKDSATVSSWGGRIINPLGALYAVGAQTNPSSMTYPIRLTSSASNTYAVMFEDGTSYGENVPSNTVLASNGNTSRVITIYANGQSYTRTVFAGKINNIHLP